MPPLEKHGLEAVLLEAFGKGFLGGGPPEKHVLKLLSATSENSFLGGRAEAIQVGEGNEPVSGA